MFSFPEVMRIKSRIRTGKLLCPPAPKTCSVLERRCGDFGDNGVSAVFVTYADLANAATSRGPLRQVYRIGESNQFSAVLTVHQTASLREEMLLARTKKALRRLILLASIRPRSNVLTKGHFTKELWGQFPGLGILGGRAELTAVGW